MSCKVPAGRSQTALRSPGSLELYTSVYHPNTAFCWRVGVARCPLGSGVCVAEQETSKLPPPTPAPKVQRIVPIRLSRFPHPVAIPRNDSSTIGGISRRSLPECRLRLSKVGENPLPDSRKPATRGRIVAVEFLRIKRNPAEAAHRPTGSGRLPCFPPFQEGRGKA